MRMVSARVQVTDEISDEYIHINNCGYHIVSKTDICTTRKNGRKDYQLIYLWNGCGYFELSGVNTKVDEGHIFIYKPHQMQKYIFCAPENTECSSEIFWIHFTGRGISEILEKSGLSEEPMHYVGKCIEIKEIILKIMKEIQIKSFQNELFCDAYFTLLISHISRRIAQLKNAEACKKYDRLVSIIESMHNSYNDGLSVDDYAKKCNMSKYHFIHLFKQFTGFSPYAYKTNIRIEKAKELLSSTDFSITEIAHIIGYNNPLYFSSIFKRLTGQSPLQYKKNL